MCGFQGHALCCLPSTSQLPDPLATWGLGQLSIVCLLPVYHVCGFKNTKSL